jgi:hypothetical protein
MARERQPRGGQEEVAPGRMPETPPPRYAQPGHDFTLQAVIEMQKSLGELFAKTDRLISDVSKQGEKIDRIRLLLAWLGGGAALLGLLVGVGLTLLRLWPISSLTH